MKSNQEVDQLIGGYMDIMEGLCSYGYYVDEIGSEVELYRQLWSDGLLYSDRTEEVARSKWNQYGINIRGQESSVRGRVGEWMAKVYHLNAGNYSEILDYEGKYHQCDLKYDIGLCKASWDIVVNCQIKVVNMTDGVFPSFRDWWCEGVAERVVLVDIDGEVVWGGDRKEFWLAPGLSHGTVVSWDDMMNRVSRSYLLKSGHRVRGDRM